SHGVLVDYVTPMHTIGPKVESMMIDEMAHQLVGRHVNFLPGHELVGWEGDRGIRLRQVVTKEERTLDGIDLVVGLAGSTAVSSLADELRGRIDGIHVIGDAKEPRTVEEATVEGATLGRSV